MAVDEIAAMVEATFNESDRELTGFAWYYEHHIAVVREIGIELVEKYDSDQEVVELAALLHDIGLQDGVDRHEQRSAERATDILADHGYSENTIEAVQQAILTQETLEGRILDTADTLAHFRSPHFILKAVTADTYDEFRTWLLDKLDSDLDRIAFTDEQEEAKEIAAFWRARLNRESTEL